MEQTITITVKDKIAQNSDNSIYVCGNSDYKINFEFDGEWDELEYKTARFIKSDGTYKDVMFSGNQCSIPVITNTYNLYVGVYAGNLRTTTPAYIRTKRSILCGNGSPAKPSENVYAQIMEALQSVGKQTNAEDVTVSRFKEPHTADQTGDDTFSMRYCFPLNIYMGDCSGIKINRLGVKAPPGTTVRFAVYKQGENAMIRFKDIGDAVADENTGIAELELQNGYYLKSDEEIFFLASEAVIPCRNMEHLTVHEYRIYEDRNFVDDPIGANIPYTIVHNADGANYPIFALDVCDYTKYVDDRLNNYCADMENRVKELEKNDTSTSSVLFSQAQVLTNAQKKQARDNIGAVEMNAVKDYINKQLGVIENGAY